MHGVYKSHLGWSRVRATAGIQAAAVFAGVCAQRSAARLPCRHPSRVWQLCLCRRNARLGAGAVLPGNVTFCRLDWLDWQILFRSCASGCLLVGMPGFTGSAWLLCRAHTFQLCHAIASSAGCTTEASFSATLSLALDGGIGFACACLRLSAGLCCSYPSPFCAAPLNAPAQT